MTTTEHPVGEPPTPERPSTITLQVFDYIDGLPVVPGDVLVLDLAEKRAPLTLARSLSLEMLERVAHAYRRGEIEVVVPEREAAARAMLDRFCRPKRRARASQPNHITLLA